MTTTALRSRLTARSARSRTINGLKLSALLAVLAALSVNAPPAYGQTATGGTIHDPVPAVPAVYPDGRPAPGCMISFTSPKWPGEGPDFPCASECEGPNAADHLPSIDVMRDACMKFGPTGKSDVSFHPDHGDRQFPPGFAPPGSTRCWFMTGDQGMPNGSHFYPKGHPRCGGVSGDPHLTTFDQLRFDLQAAGEFIAAKSLGDNFEIQMRLGSHAAQPIVSHVTAVAARVGVHRVMIKARPGAPLRIDGNAIELPDGYTLAIDEGRASVIRTGRRYSVVWSDGTNLHVDIVNSTINMFVLPAEPRDGRLAGVLGNSDGDGGTNDFRTRDGKALASPPDFKTLYGVFGESWRISAAESLFDYEAGESTETFTRRDVPSRRAEAGALEPAVRARAVQRCRAAGINDAQVLADCIFDFGLTGDEEFITSALSLQTPPEFREKNAPVEVSGTSGAQSAGGVTINAPAEGIAAHSLEVSVSKAAQRGFWLGLAPAGSANDGQAANPYSSTVLTGGEQVIKFIAPTLPGDYELRYRETRGTQTVALRRPFRSVAPKLTIEAPATAAAGSSIDVRATGDIGEFMTLMVVPAGSPDAAQGPARGLQQGASSGGSIQLRNLKPGEYEIRCVSNAASGRQIYARRKLTVR